MNKKLAIKAHHAGFHLASELPHDHAFGSKSKQPECTIDALMAGEFADERLPEKFAKVEKEFKP